MLIAGYVLDGFEMALFLPPWSWQLIGALIFGLSISYIVHADRALIDRLSEPATEPERLDPVHRDELSERRYEWDGRYDRYSPHITPFKQMVEGGVVKMFKSQEMQEEGIWGIAREAPWALRRSDAQRTETGRFLLNYAERLYDPASGTETELQNRSVLGSRRFKLFHIPTRHRMAQFWEWCGARVEEQEGGFEEWAESRLRAQGDIFKMLSYLAIALRQYTHDGDDELSETPIGTMVLFMKRIGA